MEVATVYRVPVGYRSSLEVERVQPGADPAEVQLTLLRGVARLRKQATLDLIEALQAVVAEL